MVTEFEILTPRINQSNYEFQSYYAIKMKICHARESKTRGTSEISQQQR